ncbi:uncharacterized protein LOC126795083 [Argentina anserina]|uniref:uncharacterized protein LOC126795083 n=1 Tax=Argentina anserina TaxID=57926 RepID=UPI0021765D5C|nr:uncharacterized protein LOC126795083 [Potentilla anserina]
MKQGLEILKAVAQAWQSHSGSSRPMSEFDARRRNYQGRLPSRFKLEAMRKAATSSASDGGNNAKWDFGQSLWDDYEIVAVSKRLESGLVLDGELEGCSDRVHRRRRESKNSLRSLFDRMSSRRYTEADIPHTDDT